MEKTPPLQSPTTTFVHADATTFKELVQRLTGPHDEPHRPQTPIPATTTTTIDASSSKVSTGVKRPTFKLHERRQGSPRSKLTIVKPNRTVDDAGFSPGQGTRSPSTLSPSPQGSYAAARSPSPSWSPSKDMSSLELKEEEKEEKAIKERRFYLYPSPSSRSSTDQPELLPLFPLNSSAVKNPRPPLPPIL